VKRGLALRRFERFEGWGGGGWMQGNFFGFRLIKPKPNRTGRFLKNSNRFNRFFFTVRFFRLFFFRFSQFNRFFGFFTHPCYYAFSVSFRCQYIRSYYTSCASHWNDTFLCYHRDKSSHAASS